MGLTVNDSRVGRARNDKVESTRYRQIGPQMWMSAKYDSRRGEYVPDNMIAFPTFGASRIFSTDFRPESTCLLRKTKADPLVFESELGSCFKQNELTSGESLHGYTHGTARTGVQDVPQDLPITRTNVQVITLRNRGISSVSTQGNYR